MRVVASLDHDRMGNYKIVGVVENTTGGIANCIYPQSDSAYPQRAEVTCPLSAMASVVRLIVLLSVTKMTRDKRIAPD